MQDLPRELGQAEPARVPPGHTNWASIRKAELRNPDIVPAYCMPAGGCPTCGAVWVELDAVLIGPPHVKDIVVNDAVPSPVPVVLSAPQALRGVRLLCFSGHAHEHVPPTSLSLGRLAMLGAVGILGFAMMAAARRTG